ncbi:interleukin-9 receptor [Heterocephalus glaber]|uniref:Interleukin-9 receptor n=1 Tax=Heterocephalus glaber TaxID=10181 RepID=A0AAX6SH10_HETGA|nr:interleukin-9 receptor [Heterocephalus glaber]
MVPSTGPSIQSLAGWTLESEALIQDVGTWLLLCTCVCWGVSVPEEGGETRAETFTCLTNYILRIDCHWSAPELGQGCGPWLLFTSNQAPGSKHKCIFQGSSCTVVLPPEEVLLPSDNFTIIFHYCVSGKEQVSLVDSEYLPRRHVKLDPPSDLQSNTSSGSCVLTWSISPALEPMAALLSYELAFKKQEEAWERAQHKDHIVGVTLLTLEAVELDPGSTYEARLRVQMAMQEEDMAEEECHEGQWSKWSQPVCFFSPQPHALPTGLLISSEKWPETALVAVTIFLLLTGLTYLLFKLSSRMKRTFYQNVPSPVAFFQPLYTEHGGNFQTWTEAHRAGPQPTQDCDSIPQGASESGVWEAIALLTYGPAWPWQPSGLEGKENPGSGLPKSWSLEDVLPAGCVELEGQPSPYLPQEDWAPMSSTRPASPDSEGGSGDYCVLDCYGGCHPSALPGNTQSPMPLPALACGLSWVQQGLDAQQRGACEGAAHSQGHGLPEDL